ncbi:hypothetical protein ACEU6E_03910 [Halorutilales archaeon Cl-col2-1]
MVCEQIFQFVSGLFSGLTSISAETALLAAPIFVATVSLVLQYISHRNSVLDSRFEREQKIDEVIGGSRAYELDDFTGTGYSARLTPDRVRIKENQGRLHTLFKYLNPFGELQGDSLIAFEFGMTGEDFRQGAYHISGFPDDTGIEEGILIVTPNSQISVFVVDVDTVDQYEVSSNLGNLWNAGQHLDTEHFNNIDSPERTRIMNEFF